MTEKSSLKGFVKGFATVSILILAALALIFIANYVSIAFAAHNITDINARVTTPRVTNTTSINVNATDVILYVNLTTSAGGNITNITVDIARAGFVNFTTNNSIVCPVSAASSRMNASIPSTGIAACENATSDGNLTGAFTIAIKNLNAARTPGTFTIEANTTNAQGEKITNTTTLTFLALDVSATVNDTESIVSRQKSYNFTITNNASAGGLEDSIKEVTIDYSGAGFDDPASGNITCAGPGGSWTLANNSVLNRVTCIAPGGGELAAGSSALSIIIQRWGSTGTAGTNRFDVLVNGTTGGGTYNASGETRPTVTTVGTFTITRKGVGPAQRPVSSDGIAVLQLNFSTTGEGANITVVNLTRQGSATDNEVFNVSLANDTDLSGTFNAGDVIISGTANALNTSSAGIYTFSGFQFNITSGGSKTLFVVLSTNTTTVAGGRTFNFTLNGTGDVNVITATTNKNFTGTSNITITNTTVTSVLSTITGTLTVTGRSLAPLTRVIGTANFAFLQLNFTANGEQINVTRIDISRIGSATDTDIVNVRLFNDTSGNGAFDSGTDTQIGPANSTSLNGFYEFRDFQYNVSTSGINTLFVVANVSGAATGGNTFNLSLNGTGSVVATTGVTNQAIGSTTNITLTSTQAALTTTIHGTLSVTGKALNANTTAIGTAGVPVLLLNFTANGEQVNITVINITRTGSATDTDGIFNITLYNDTDRSGTLNAGDLRVFMNATQNAINTTTSGGYLLFGMSYNVTTAGSSLLVLLSTNNSASTGGKTFNLSVNATGSIQAFTASSNVNLTATSNITLTTTTGNLTTIFGTLNLSAADLALANANNGQFNVSTMRLSFTATGENVNITAINITLNNSGGMNDVDISRVLLYNDTDGNGILGTGDQILAPGSAFVSNQTRFIINFTALTGSTTVFIVGFDIGTGAAGNGVVDAFMGEAGNITAVGATSGIGIASTGAPASAAGSTTIKILSATATVCIGNPCTSTSTRININDTFNFTITNGGGIADVINQIIINYDDSDFADPVAANVICPTISGGTWNRELNAGGDVVICSNNTQTNSLGVGAKANITISGFTAPTSTGSKTFNITVRGGANGTFAITTSKPSVTVSGELNISGASLAPSTRAVNARNVSILRLNFTASGEQMNVSSIIITMNESAAQADIFNVRLVNDTDLSGTFTSGDTTLGTPQNTTTALEYRFSSFQYNITTAANQSLLVLVDINITSSNGGRTFRFNVNSTDNVTTTGGTTAVAVLENLTTTVSDRTTIHGVLNVTGKNLSASTVAVSTSGYSVLQLNFTAIGEQMNITSFNISRLGSVVDGDIFNVSLYNDTDLSGTFNAGDGAIGTTQGQNTTLAGGLYLFNLSTFDVAAASDKTLFVVVSINNTAGKTFNLSLNATGNINVLTGVSNINLTRTGGGGNITLTTTESTTTTTAGTLTIRGRSDNLTEANVNRSAIAVIRYNFSSTGEGYNVTVIKITRSGTATDSDIFNVTLYVDTDGTAAFTVAGDTRMGTTQNTTTSSKYVFTGFQFNTSTTDNGNSTLFVVVSTNTTGGGNSFNLSIASTDDVNVIGATSAANTTETLTAVQSVPTEIHGITTVTGRSIAPAQKAANSTGVAVLQLNFTSVGESMNLSVLNITRTGTAVDGDVFNVSLFNDTDLSGTFNAGDGAIGTVGLNTSASGQYVFSSLGFNFPTTGKTLFVVLSINDTASRSFNFSLVASGDYSVIGATSAENLTGSTNITLDRTQSTVGTITHGTLRITAADLAPSTASISQGNLSVIRYNFSATGENVIVSVLNFTRTGSATDSDIDFLALWNDTDSSGTFNAGDDRIGAALNSSSSGIYTFAGLAYNVTTSRVNTLFLMVNTTSGATGGRTFNFTLNATGDVSAVGSNSTVNITATSNITLTNPQSSTTTIHGKLTITGSSLSPVTKVVDTADLAVLQLNFSATGEGFNISLINITINGTATEANLTNFRLFLDRDATGTFSASSDTQLGSAVTSASVNKVVFTGFQYNVTTSGQGNNTLFVVVNISGASGSGGRSFSLSLNKTGDIQLVGAGSNRNITADANVTLTSTESVTARIHGKVTFTGTGLLTSAVSVSTDGISVLRINITPVGEAVNITVLNVTRGGNASDGHIFNVSLYNDTDLSGTFNSGDTALDTVGLNTTTSGLYTFTALGFNVPVAGKSVFLVATTNSTADPTFRLSLNGTGSVNLIGATSAENLTGSANITLTTTGSNVSEIVSLSITGRSLAPSTKAVNTADVSVLMLNFTSGGEGMNVSVIRITRNESATDSDISNVRLFNDTDLSGTFNAGDTQIGAAVNTTSAGQYEFAGLTYNIFEGDTKTLIAVVNTSAGTGGRTFRFNVNSTGDVNTISATTALNVTETLTTPVSSRTTIHGTVTVAGSNIVASSVSVNTGGVSVIRFNITPVGEGVNITVLNVTRGGNASDGHIFNVSLFNDTDLSGTFNAGDTTLGTVGLNTTTSGNYVFSGLGFNVPVAGKSLFLVVTSNSTADVTFNLALNGTGSVNLIGATTGENLTGSTNITLTTTGSATSETVSLSITGTSLAPATKAVNSANVSTMLLNLTAGGEGMNVSVIKITRNESATDSDISNVRLINDTNLNGVFDTSDDQIGPTVNATSASQYEFAGLTFNIIEGGTKSLIVVVNTSSATGGRTFRFNINATGDVNTVAQTTAINVTETLTTPVSGRTTIHGTVSITGSNVVASSVSVNTAGISVVRFNITPVGEGVNITVFNVTRGGNATDGAGIFNVSLFNDTDLSGTFNAGDTTLGTVGLNTTTSGNYVFSGLGFNVPVAGKSLFLVVTSNSTADVTFNLALNGTGSVNMIGATTGENLTGSTNITLTTTGSSTSETVSLAIIGTSVAPSTKVINSANVSVLLLNLTAGGEGMNVSVIKITRNESATDSDISNVRLFNDTDLSGTFNAGDTQIGAAVSTTSAGQYEFAGLNYNISEGGTKTLIVVVNTSAGTGGRTFRFNINTTTDVNTISQTTALNVTETLTTPVSGRTLIHGVVTLTGKVLNTDFAAINTAGFSVLQLNITPTGEGVNITVLNITRTGTVADGDIFNVSLFNDTDLSGTFNTGDTAIGTRGVNTSASGQYVLTGFQFNVSAGSDKTLFIIVSTNTSSTIGGLTFNLSLVSRGDASVIGATTGENLTGSTNITLTTAQSNSTKIYGTLTITGSHVANTSAPFGASDLSIMRYNFSATGEGMNISVVKVTRSGTTNDSHIINVRLYNDTNGNGVFNPSGDTQIGSAQNSTTNGQYVFSGLQYNVTATGVNTLFVVVNTSGPAAGKTFRFNINATTDMNTIGAGSAFNITETLTTAEGSQVVVFGTLTVRGVSLVGGQGPDAPECAVNTKRCFASNEANIAVARLNFTATDEGFNVTVIKLTRAGASTLSDDHIVNVRLFNDTNANDIYDSADTQIGSALSVSSSNVYSFAGFQYNISTSGVNTLFVVINTTAKAGWDPQVYFNLSLGATTDINAIGSLSSENITETLTQTHSNTTKITERGWYNNTAVLQAGWTSFFIPTQTIIETTGRNATNTGNFNFTSILSSLGSNWNYMYYNINGSSTGWVLADRTDPGGSTLRFVNNTNDKPYWINMSATDRFEL